ncbi:unnamed protein product, partial [Bathycoccus prasinos]
IGPFVFILAHSSARTHTPLQKLLRARIESREDSKTLTVAEIGKNGVFFVMQNIKIFIIHWKYCRGPVDFQKESVLLLESILGLLGNTQYEYAVAFKNLKFFQAQSTLIRCTFKEAVNFFDKEYFDFKAIFEKRSFTCWSRLRIE